jgi:hypothetical protein
MFRDSGLQNVDRCKNPFVLPVFTRYKKEIVRGSPTLIWFYVTPKGKSQNSGMEP